MRNEARMGAQNKGRQNRWIYAGIIIAVILVVAALVAKNNEKSDKNAASNSTTTITAQARTFPAKDSNCPKDLDSLPKKTSFSDPQPFCLDKGKTYTATMSTDTGDIVLKLDPKKAPNTVNNFVMLSKYHFYDGLTFHRVIENFMAQGGDPKGDGTGGPGYEFADELPSSVSQYKKGSLAMANSGANTNGSQFFIVFSDQGGQSLGQPSYSLFGQVTDGFDTLTKIEADASADSSGVPPKVTHTINSVTIKES